MVECVTLSLKSSPHIPLPSSILPTAKMRYASYSNFLFVSPSPLSLCSAHLSRPAHRAQHFSRGLTQAHPFSFSPALHPILYLISAVHLRQGPTLRHCVVRCPPIYSGASGERSRGPVYVVTSQGLSESCSPHHWCNRRVRSRGQLHILSPAPSVIQRPHHICPHHPIS